MSQLIKPQIKWTPEKIQLLRDIYPLGDKHKLAKDLGIKWSTLKDAARRFKVRSLIDPRGYRAAKLLDESLESYYWHGFIMADGHIGIRNCIKFALSPNDEQQLINFRTFLNIDQPIVHRSCDTTYSKNTKSVGISISDVDTCEKLRSLYKVGEKKTYNPPDITNILNHKDQFIAFFIGFFDGDGCLNIHNDIVTSMKIECHQNWRGVLGLIGDGLVKYLGIKSSLHLTSRGYACFRISRYHNIMKLKQFILDHGIPAMARKWDRVDMNRIYKGGPNNPVKLPNLKISLKDTVTYNNVTKTVKEWAYDNDILSNVLTARLSRRWPVEDALHRPVINKQKN